MRKILSILAILLFCCQALVSAPRVRTGIEVLSSRNFEGLQGKKVGLLTNPSGVDSQLRSTIDILFKAPGVELKALFAPEHGVRGDAYAGDYVESTTDPATGLPVYSLYGPNRSPRPEMLAGLDVVVYDIQDVGCRSYTFISSLGLMMRACAPLGIEVMVLDRPNPLGGNKVEGACVRPGFFSFVGQYKIPYLYGLTVGELAILINEEGLNCGQRGNEAPLKCKLSVIPMEGWTRDMLYTDTGLPWVLPSPNIPYPQSAVNYPVAGVAGEFNNYLNIGIGYSFPFGAFAEQWIDADALKAKLESYEIPGVVFRTVHYKPFFGRLAGKLIHGVQFGFTDYDKAPLSLVSFYVMQAIGELYGKNPFTISPERIGMFNKITGSDRIASSFGKTLKVEDMLGYWTADVEEFRKLSSKYYLY
ncbi:MAG: DUF1343 domain-containing protein [Bacteroidales bacterium]|nr:DUF1343 domain-containing protein [Bacteroidales bacterium]